jgi:predicted dinucleotide-binding enzyme
MPYGSVEPFGQEHGARLQGKIVTETGNPYAQRDGAVAEQVPNADVVDSVESP